MGLQAQLRVGDRPLDGLHLIEAAGEADLSTTADFAARLLKISEDGDRKIVLDLSDLRFMDSTMVHAIISAAPRIRSRGGDMAIVCSDANIGRILEITAVDGIYRVVASTEEALEALGAA